MSALDPQAFQQRLDTYLQERSEEARAVRVGEKETSEQAAIVARYAGLFTREQLETLAGAEAAATGLADLEPWSAETIEARLKELCEELGEKPRTVYAPIRVAVTGSRVSPGLYESLELLGREATLERLRRGVEVAAS